MKESTKKEKVAKESLKYDAFSLQDIETKIETFHTASKESQKEMYEALEYLRMTGRYKENPTYAKSSFWKYLDDRFTIRKTTYLENVYAFTRHPIAAIKHGAGLVSKVNRLCGRTKVSEVFEGIEAEAQKRKKPLSRAKIEDIIIKHADPAKLVEKKNVNWKVMYEQELAAHQKTKEALRGAMAKVKELEGQVGRLKKTANVFMDIRHLVENTKPETVFAEA